MGLCVWSPNIEEPVNSLLISACQISAISTFCQIASAGAYNHMNINQRHISNFPALTLSYNHFAHHVMMEQFKKEKKEAGTFHHEEEKKDIQKGWERVSLILHIFNHQGCFHGTCMQVLSLHFLE